MSGSLKIRDVLVYVETLKAEIKARRNDLEAQRGIVRGQAAELNTLRLDRAALLTFVRGARDVTCDSRSGECCDEYCANGLIPKLLKELERIPGMAEALAARGAS